MLILFLLSLGALTGLAFPPYSYFPVIFVSYPLLAYFIVKTSSKRVAFLRSFIFGFGQFTATLYWVSLAFISPGIDLAWALPFLLIGLPLGLALFTGCVGLFYKILRPKQIGPDVFTVFMFTGLWSMAELMRGYLFTGFPWNLAGTVFWDTPVFQTLSLWGIYGLSFITILVATAPLMLKKRPFIGFFMPVILISSLWYWGQERLDNSQTQFHQGPYIRLVQAHIDQGHKWNPELAQAHLKAHMDLSALPSNRPLTHIIWPETAVNYTLNQDDEIRTEIARTIRPGAYFIGGSVHYVHKPEERLGNSLYVLDHQGDIITTYDKQHLIPFAEYVPFRGAIPMDKLVFGPIDYSPGKGLTTIHLQHSPPFSPLICYEVIFPGAVTKAGDRPAWLLNITNDGWYGLSSGPYQHFQITRMRTIEEGLPLARAANTGISAIIDSYGRVVKKLDLGKTGVVDSQLPVSLEVTTFNKGGKYLVFLFILMILLPYLFISRKKRFVFHKG